MEGFPLMVGKKQDNGAIEMYQGGFKIVGGDSKGKCINSNLITGGNADFLAEMGDPTLKFNVDLSYGCFMEYTHSELESKCSSVQAPLVNLEIFNNLDKFDHFGIFGSANIYYPSDWSEISFIPLEILRVGQAKWDPTE